MIHGKYINQGGDLTDVLKVRQLSLCDAIENISPEADEPDALAVNILVDLPVESANGEKKKVYMGCGRILCDIDRFRFYIDQVAILPEFRHCGYGEFALRMLVDKANLCGAQKVWLKLPEKWASKEAEETALKFFAGMHFHPEAYDESVSDESVSDETASGKTASDKAAFGAGRWMSADIKDFHSCCHQ